MNSLLFFFPLLIINLFHQSYGTKIVSTFFFFFFLLEILEDCIVFLNEKIYINALYRRLKCAVQIKCSTRTCVLYK